MNPENANQGGQDLNPQDGIQPQENPTPAPQEIDEYNPFMEDVEEETPETPVDEPIEVDEETSKIVNQEVSKKVTPIEKRLRENEYKMRVSNFLQGEGNKELFGDLEPKVMDLLKRNPRVSDLKPDALFRLVAGDIGNRIAKQQSEADEMASRTQTGNQVPRQKEAPVEDFLNMSDEAWKQAKAKKYKELGMRAF